MWAAAGKEGANLNHQMVTHNDTYLFISSLYFGLRMCVYNLSKAVKSKVHSK